MDVSKFEELLFNLDDSCPKSVFSFVPSFFAVLWFQDYVFLADFGFFWCLTLFIT